MDSKIFFQACQEGDVEKLSEQFEANKELEISGKDGYGMTALAYAARNGHVEVVRQLLLKGADRTEVLEQGYGKSNAEIARLLEEGASGPTPVEFQASDEADNHQNMPLHQMNEGPYMNGAVYPPQGYPMMPNYGGPIPGQQYYYDGGNANGAPAGPAVRNGHSRKESTANLPPAEVARSIPCKFFPNCRYGDKCMFAHPVMAMSSGPPGSAPLSPSMSPPPMQPIFYQHMPAGYPYPGPYGAGPQFYPSMGPMQPPYGMVPPFNQPMMQPQHPHHSQHIPSTPNDGNETLADKEQAEEIASSSQAAPENEGQPATHSSLQTAPETNLLNHAEGRDATATPPQQDGAAPVASNGQQDENRGVNGAEDVASSDSAHGKPAHRRQSFNSFLHHHAVPFQPTMIQQPSDIGMMNTMQAFVPRMVPKNRRTPGVNGAGKRGSENRSACMFFSGRGCKFGDECRFPHILPDGTDARPIQMQQRQVYASAYGAVNPAMRMQANGVIDAPASAPTGPQAEKKTASDKQPHEQGQQTSQQVSVPLQVKSTLQSSSAANGPAVVVPSIPSKTSTGTSPSNPRGSHNKKQQSQNQQQQSSQPAQRIPTVNDFPALAVVSPNLGGQAPTIPSPPSEAAVAVTSTSSTVLNGDNSTAATPTTTSAPAATANGKRANFSAILSAPAPPKPKAAVESSSTKAASTEGDGHKEDESSSARGNETQAKTNGSSKEVKPRSKESKAANVKVDSYKSAVISPSKATLQDEDDFQLVHRSRTSNSNQSKAVAA